MFSTRALLILGGLTVIQPSAGAQEKKPLNWSEYLIDALERTSTWRSNGTVQDVFDGDLLLLSFGSDQGAKKGQRLEVYRLKPGPRYVAIAEITAVGSHYSLARITRLYVAPEPEDRVVGDFKPLPPAFVPPLPDFRDFPDRRFGGAIIIEELKPRKKSVKIP